MVDLQQSRIKIDEIDQKIVELFEERMEIAKDVAEYKISTGKKVYDREREIQKLISLGNLASSDFNKQGIEELFTQIMSISRKLQYGVVNDKNPNAEFTPLEKLHITPSTKVAFFGEVGSYTEQAMAECFQCEVQAIAVPEFKKVMELLQKREVEYGVLPIENSSTGGITDIYDLLMEYENTIIGEHIVKVNHALMGIPGSEIEGLCEVYSHQQGILQCRSYFEQYPKITLHEAASTSAAAKKVAQEGNLSIGAIASERAAKQYGLEILARKINRENKNSTRFIIIANKRIFLQDANKVSICFELPHESGSLYNMLSHMIFNNLNMTKIESRPISGHPWEYRFFVEFEGNLQQPGVKNALQGIGMEATSLRILGNFHTI